ncbi:MAG: hypothetical protein ABW007_24860 [Chitinophagaceae bacterium]
MNYLQFLLPILICAQLQQTTGKGFYYCIDHKEKKVYYSNGDVTIKKGLQKDEFYQYGFMKQKGWINRSWDGLEYKLILYPKAVFLKSSQQSADSLFNIFRGKGYTKEQVPMPYPMKPFTNYKKDGTN